MVEYNSSGDNSQEKEDVQEVATIESTRRSCCLQRGRERERSKENVTVERARVAQELYEKLDTREGEKAIYIYICWQNLETRQPKITSKVTL